MAASIARLLAEVERLTETGTFAWDLSADEWSWSDEMFRIHGLDPGSAAPSLETLLTLTHPRDAARVERMLRRVATAPDQVTERGVSVGYRAHHPDGSIRDVRAHLWIGPDGVQCIGCVCDWTDERQATRELDAHNALRDALAESESVEHSFRDVLERMAIALDYPVAEFWARGPAMPRIVSRASWCSPRVDCSEFEAATADAAFDAGEGLPGGVWARGEPLVTDDVVAQLVFAPRRTAALRIGLQSCLAFPATSDDGPLAVLMLYDFDRRPPRDRLVRTVTALGDELGRYLASHRDELEPARLPRRQLEVLKLAADGLTNQEIADRLDLGHTTVKTHLDRTYAALGVRDRASAVAYALRHGLIR